MVYRENTIKIDDLEGTQIAGNLHISTEPYLNSIDIYIYIYIYLDIYHKP